MNSVRLEQVVTKTTTYLWVPREGPTEIFEVSTVEAKQLWRLGEDVQFRTKTRFSFVPVSTKDADLQSVT